ncbi:hypothetical protein [Actinocrispum wychmicini]|uniref:Integral membrane plasmid transfer protein n=1 Tax=Actinocrispum wychmicini TaxID=1213861 RepID=A0A4R2JGJ5_9PSEU|nr:hypothetical protein [Actinocrispum wychmicini]TCO56056.1 hypothetical protein EV192_107481 [Actinocrispum wychmicini]
MSDDAVFPEFVKDLLAVEDKRRETLEARGASVITVSGTLVTLLVALGAFVPNRQGFVLPDTTRAPLSVAVIAFVVAALLGIATYVPQRVRLTDPNALAELLPGYWPKGREFALKKVTATRLEQLTVLQKGNDWKARALLAAVVGQVVAVGALAWAVLVIL